MIAWTHMRVSTFAGCALLLWACHESHNAPVATSNKSAEIEKPNLALACPPGRGDCDGVADNGCESELSNDTHCGTCDVSCTSPATCAFGRCRTGVVEIAAGGSHTCARTAEGELYCFGLSGVGQLGLPQERVQTTPAKVAGLPKIKQVVAGRYFTCVLDIDGHASCFGDRGQLGDEPPTGGPQPHALPFAEVVSLTAGANHACALTKSGASYCWGGNIKGQLGDGVTTEYQVTPVAIAGLAHIKTLEAGNAHTCALLDDGHLRCWGDNQFGQLGDGTTEDRPAPTPVVGLENVVEVSAGEFYTCARTLDGRVHCFGRNDQGQLGDGTQQDRPQPVNVAIQGVTQLSAGERHTCMCTTDGKMHCMGDNGSGRLGLAIENAVATPTQVPLAGKCLQVSAGSMHTCVLVDDGSVYCAGQNDGQLGDGTTKNRHTLTKAQFEFDANNAR